MGACYAIVAGAIESVGGITCGGAVFGEEVTEVAGTGVGYTIWDSRSAAVVIVTGTVISGSDCSYYIIYRVGVGCDRIDE